MTTKFDNAREQARAQLAHIVSLVDELDRALAYIDNPEIDGKPVDVDEMLDTAQSNIRESALSVEVRGPWRPVGPTGNDWPDTEFCILLATGGPAVRIIGELDRYGNPDNAWLEYQDWGTPWTEYSGADVNDLLQFCQQFYFGN